MTMMMLPEDIKPGDVFEITHPFCREVYEHYDCDEGGCHTKKIPCWRPGVYFRQTYSGEGETVANGEGEQVLTIIDVHKPGRFPTRIFYTRHWSDPDGNVFGKKKVLRIMSIGHFNTLLSGYRHKYEIEAKEES